MSSKTYCPITNPVTRDRCLILKSTPTELRIRFWIAPGSVGAPLHYHRSMMETFRVLEGVMTLELDRKGGFSVLDAGSSIAIEPGRPHSFSNRDGADWLVFEAYLQPPTGFLTFLLGLYGLAGAGKVHPTGMPRNPIALLRLLAFGDIWLPGVPLLLQRGLFGAVGRLSSWFGVDDELRGFASTLLRAAADHGGRS